MKYRLVAVLVEACTVSLLGCATSQLVPGSPSVNDFRFNATRDRVFDAALSVAQELNLAVEVLARDSGFLQFKRATLSAAQLDVYCYYPWVRAGSNIAWDTFQNWNNRSIYARAGVVSGSVTLTLILAEDQGGTTRGTLGGNWIAGNLTEVQQCNSRGVLESEFESRIRNRLSR